MEAKYCTLHELHEEAVAVASTIAHVMYDLRLRSSGPPVLLDSATERRHEPQIHNGRVVAASATNRTLSEPLRTPFVCTARACYVGHGLLKALAGCRAASLDFWSTQLRACFVTAARVSGGRTRIRSTLSTPPPASVRAWGIWRP